MNKYSEPLIIFILLLIIINTKKNHIVDLLDTFYGKILIFVIFVIIVMFYFKGKMENILSIIIRLLPVKTLYTNETKNNIYRNKKQIKDRLYNEEQIKCKSSKIISLSSDYYNNENIEPFDLSSNININGYNINNKPKINLNKYP